MTDYKINILHIYPDLLNLYGDKGNIACLKKRLEWRGIAAEVRECTAQNPNIDFENTDIIFIGGGSDRETEIVRCALLEKKDDFIKFVEDGGTVIALCSGYELLGKAIQMNDEKKEGLGVLDICTHIPSDNSRLIGNIVIDCGDIAGKVVGFENHSGRIDIGSHTPLGKAEKGFGNDGKSGFEGVLYKNVLASYLHGPLFPKNPMLCDYVLKKTLIHKYSDFTELAPLDDETEDMARNHMLSVLL
ncbi:MAG: glutamine amidotransferase [Clostridia bacterium]|nr:glutamine amidotransferase [Clostridia bacterium]